MAPKGHLKPVQFECGSSNSRSSVTLLSLNPHGQLAQECPWDPSAQGYCGLQYEGGEEPLKPEALPIVHASEYGLLLPAFLLLATNWLLR